MNTEKEPAPKKSHMQELMIREGRKLQKYFTLLGIEKQQQEFANETLPRRRDPLDFRNEENNTRF